MKIAVHTASLGNFDTLTNGFNQNIPVEYFAFTDLNFPPITGLTPRFQYRIPKLFSWDMKPGYDVYIWMDGAMIMLREDTTQWLLEQLGDADIAFFKHPWRDTIREEVEHIEDKLQQGNRYIVSRYKNGLHREMLNLVQADKSYKDNWLFASTVFIYRNNERVQDMMASWWFYQSRYYTCDQVCLPYVLRRSEVNVNVIDEDIFKNEYIAVGSKHH
jgi:hypothetical protein